MLIGLPALVALFYAASVHSLAGDSDGATVVLEGYAMSGGHVMLHGWALSLDSFWSADALFYMVAEVVTGVRSMLLYFVPAVIAMLVVLTGVVLARDGRRGVPRFAGAATVVALLALPSHALSVFLLRGPLHVCTALWCLVAFVGLRSRRIGWGWVIAVVFFAAGMLGDLQTVVLGIVPAFAAGVVSMLRWRDWRKGVPLVSAAAGAVALSAIARAVARAIGTFTVTTTHPTASRPQALENFRYMASWGANMLGVGRGSFGSGNVPTMLQAVHVLGVVVVVGGVAVATWSLVRGAVRGDRRLPVSGVADSTVDDLLVLAFFADLVVFVFLTSSNSPGFMRYLTAAVIFGAVLGGRLMAWVAAMVTSQRARQWASVLGVAVVATFAASFAISVTTPVPTQPVAQLGDFLQTHQLRQGIGDYWSASITTVTTNGTVTIRPVITDPTGTVVRYQRQSDVGWYAGQRFTFLVYNSTRPWGGISSSTATRTFGPVAHTYAVGTYRVLVWNHTLSVPATGFSPVPVKTTGTTTTSTPKTTSPASVASK